MNIEQLVQHCKERLAFLVERGEDCDDWDSLDELPNIDINEYCEDGYCSVVAYGLNSLGETDTSSAIVYINNEDFKAEVDV